MKLLLTREDVDAEFGAENAYRIFQMDGPCSFFQEQRGTRLVCVVSRWDVEQFLAVDAANRLQGPRA